MSVFSHDKKIELIGTCDIDLGDIIIPGGGQNDLWHPLTHKNQYAGEIMIDMTYHESRSKVERPLEKERDNLNNKYQDSRLAETPEMNFEDSKHPQFKLEGIAPNQMIHSTSDMTTSTIKDSSGCSTILAKEEHHESNMEPAGEAETPEMKTSQPKAQSKVGEVPAGSEDGTHGYVSGYFAWLAISIPSFALTYLLPRSTKLFGHISFRDKTQPNQDMIYSGPQRPSRMDDKQAILLYERLRNWLDPIGSLLFTVPYLSTVSNLNGF